MSEVPEASRGGKASSAMGKGDDRKKTPGPRRLSLVEVKTPVEKCSFWRVEGDRVLRGLSEEELP